MHAKTRKRMLVEMLHEHGISISYDRVLEVSAQLGDAAVSKYMKDGVVCPHVLRRGLFITAAMDNIDHNPTSTTATTARKLYRSIGPEKGRGITLFHAFTGCDVVSAFRGKGKKSAWQTWDMCDVASDVFARLSQYPPTVNDNEMDILEKFVVIMYDRSSTATCVNNAMLDMFGWKQRPYQAIPPTRSALLQYVNHAAYQAGCVWSKSTLRHPETQSPADWEWAKNGDLWNVVWTTLPPIVESCQLLTKWGCKSDCHGRCTCYRLGLSCTALCSCRCKT